MPPRRYTTVYDVSGLRVHADGTRVDQTDDNLRILKRKAAAKDANGNWIAHDAGGPLKPARVAPLKQDEPCQTDAQKRRLKRQKFFHDYSFLDGQDSESNAPPSSDLLKCIHHAASSYYTEQGILRNAGKQYRALKRAKRKSQQSDDKDSDEEEDEEESSEEDSEYEHGKPKRKHRRTRTTEDEREDHDRDMYRAMDGSALVAIGILLQEHVARMLEADIPEEWVDEEDRDVDDIEQLLVGDIAENDTGADEEENT